MVRVVKIASRYYGIEECDCDGDFWDEAQECAMNGESIIIAEDRNEAEAMCAGDIDWYYGGE